METQNEKRKGATIPVDMVIEILTRLPAKSVVRFGCVSKQWSSITTTPHFIKSFNIHSSARPSLLRVLEDGMERVFFSFPYHQDPQNRYTPVEKYHMLTSFRHGIDFFGGGRPFPIGTNRILNSINGLMLSNNLDAITVWNLTLRQHAVLPYPEFGLGVALLCFLGYDPIDQKYKVLAMSCNKYCMGGNVKVLTLGAQESWRVIKVPSGPSQDDIPLKHSIMMMGLLSYHETLVQGGICINGVVYFFEIPSNFIMSFDVRSETFETIRKPDGASGLLDRHVTYALINYQGKLAWICSSSNRLWVLEDAKNNEWSLSYFNPLITDDDQIIHSYFSGVTDAHEVIYMPKSIEQPFCAFYHDLKSNSTRQVLYQEINHKRSDDDGESPRFNHMFDYDYIPGYTENLMSLKSLGFNYLILTNSLIPIISYL